MSESVEKGLVAKYSVVRALAVLGDGWTLLILRSAFYGTHRFTDWQEELGVPKAVLSNRLERLVEAKVLRKTPSQAGGKRMEYRLDEAGLALWEPMSAIFRWTYTWSLKHDDDQLPFHHETCGNDCDLVLSCDACAQPISPFDTFAKPGPGAGLEDRIEAHSRRRANSAARHGEQHLGSAEVMAMFGDVWSPAIIASTFRGARRFNDLVSYLRIPPLVLSMRIKELLALGILTRKSVEDSERYEAFHLTRVGMDLFPYIAMLAKWGDRWCGDQSGVPLVFHHKKCGHRYIPNYRCSVCGERVNRSEIRLHGANV